jgi:NAD(P)H-dependent FMN reductase
MLAIAVLTGTRRGHFNDVVARWVVDVARPLADVHVSLVNLGFYRLSRPETDQTFRTAASEHLRAWSRTVASMDGFVFVTADHNPAASSALQCAIDAFTGEWRNKAAGFVGYGTQGAEGANEDLRESLAVAGVTTVGPRVALTLVPDVRSRSLFVPHPRHIAEMDVLFEQLLSWAGTMKAVRAAMRLEPCPAFTPMRSRSTKRCVPR